MSYIRSYGRGRGSINDSNSSNGYKTSQHKAPGGLSAGSYSY